jgi:hypothetical protein
MPIDRWTSSIDNTTNDFVKSFGTLTSMQLNWKPNADTWSIAQNIDHLITINSTYLPILASLEANTYSVPPVGKVEFLVRYFGKFILRSVQPDRRRKMKTFAIWEPVNGELDGDVLGRFQTHQQLLKTTIQTHQDLLRRNPVISSPANRFVVYRLQTAFDIIITHEKRHYEQAAELLPHVKV